MITLTGVAWVDWTLIAAALVAALYTIYFKALRPLWRGIVRLRRFFNKVENLFDLGDALPPETRTALLATQATLLAGHDEIMGELGRTNTRIDTHMAHEEASLTAVADSVARIGNAIEATQRTVADHLALDEQRFGEAHVALVSGQGELVNRLQSIEAAVKGRTP